MKLIELAECVNDLALFLGFADRSAPDFHERLSKHLAGVHRYMIVSGECRPKDSGIIRAIDRLDVIRKLAEGAQESGKLIPEDIKLIAVEAISEARQELG